MMTDLEGVAGVHLWESRQDQSLENYERRMRQRVWLAEEVNAACRGFYDNGGDEMIVNDGHGAGYTMDLDYIDPRPDIVHGMERPFWLPFLDESCDATGIVGGHAKAGTPNATLCHTMSSEVRDWSFNGISLGEMGLQAAIAGHYDVPFIFCSGDAHACKEMEELIPGCVTVPVKWGTSRHSELTLPPAEARVRIEEGMAQAMKAVGDIAPFKIEGPILFRGQHIDPVYDEENPRNEYIRVIDSHTIEIDCEDIIDFMYKYYGYPRDWAPLNFVPAWKK